MSIWKDLYTNVNEQPRRGKSEPTEAQKRLSDAMDAASGKKTATWTLRAAQQRVEKMTEEALKSPQYKKLIERAKQSGKKGSLLLAPLIAIYGSVENIPPSKHKANLLMLLNKKSQEEIEDEKN